MSATDLPPPPAPPAGAPVDFVCPRCAAPLRPGQDWCLECGAAVTTAVASAPAWRAPIAIVAAVLAVAAVALVLAFVELSDDSERVAQAPAATATPAAPVPSPTPGSTTIAPDASPTPGATATSTPTPGATGQPGTGAVPTPSATPGTTPLPQSSGGTDGGAFADWPAGTTAYTVILWSASTRQEAEAKARSFASSFSGVGVLESSEYSSLRPGYFVVFDGQYDTVGAAQAAARAAQASAPGAYAKQVKQ